MKNRIFITLMLIMTVDANGAGVMVIGDSLSVPDGYGLGRELEKRLKNDGHKVAVLASCGSSPEHYITGKYKTKCGFYQSKLSGEKVDITWNDFNTKKPKEAPKLTPKLDEVYVENSKPDLMVIQQGTNLYGLILNDPNGPSKVKDQVIKLMTKAKESGSKCLWVGPPKIAKLNGGPVVTKAHTDILAKAIQDGIRASGVACEYLDSRDYTDNPPGKDGTHFSKFSQTEKWIEATHQAVGKLLNSKSAKEPVNSPKAVVVAKEPVNPPKAVVVVEEPLNPDEICEHPGPETLDKSHSSFFKKIVDYLKRKIAAHHERMRAKKPLPR